MCACVLVWAPRIGPSASSLLCRPAVLRFQVCWVPWWLSQKHFTPSRLRTPVPAWSLLREQSGRAGPRSHRPVSGLLSQMRRWLSALWGSRVWTTGVSSWEASVLSLGGGRRSLSTLGWWPLLPVSPGPLGPSALFWGLARQSPASNSVLYLLSGDRTGGGAGSVLEAVSPLASSRGLQLGDSNAPAVSSSCCALPAPPADPESQGPGPEQRQPQEAPGVCSPSWGGSRGPQRASAASAAMKPSPGAHLSSLSTGALAHGPHPRRGPPRAPCAPERLWLAGPPILIDSRGE